METREETVTAVLRVFGREPLVEDGRYVGRWVYAAAWLAKDHATARDLVRARLAGAARAALGAAMGAGRGNAERFTLVSALSRLPETIETGEGPFADAVGMAIDEAASRLAEDGEALRSLTARERTAFAARFPLESFDAALRELGPDRHVWLRETAAQLEEALLGARGACPALRTLRLYLQATLALDASEARVAAEIVPTMGGEPLDTLGFWLSADLAIAARRAGAFGAAWTAAARSSGDALSKTLAGLTSGAMQSNNVAEALGHDPWALALALAMTTEAEHASALLDCGATAQAERRAKAGRRIADWAAQAERVDDLERRLGLSVLTSYEDREGHRDHGPAGSLNLFSAWGAIRAADAAQSGLRTAVDRAVAAETMRRREAVRQAKGGLENLRQAHEATLGAARDKLDQTSAVLEPSSEDEGAHKGCVFGFGAGCSVIATYVVVGFVLGTGGVVGKIAPLVAAAAALPVGAAIVAQIAQGLRRASRVAEASRRREAAKAAFDRARQTADLTHGGALAKARGDLEEAERDLAEFERQIGAEIREAA